MRILMLGNSFTFFHDMPSMLAQMTGAEVVQHTRGGARLAEQLNASTKMGAATQAALRDERWDYVVLQEMSHGPITSKKSFLNSVSALCEQIRQAGAKPVLYATWAYEKGGAEMDSFSLSYDEMYLQLYAAYHEAAEMEHCLVADVGKKFYELSETQELYDGDAKHPSEAGSRLAAETIAAVILEDREASIVPDAGDDADEMSDSRLRLFYLYHLLQKRSDEDHPLTTKQIQDLMEELHGIRMHRTTVPKDIALLRAAGVDIISERRRAWQYYLADRTFSVPELKILIDAVQSSKFITEKKSRALIEKLMSLTSDTSADRLRRTVHISGRAKTDNEKGYYIVDAVNEAIQEHRKISFYYIDFDSQKKRVVKNHGKPYKVSPYDLIWDGDFYYLTGFCDERGEVRTFRVDRIKRQPDILEEQAVPKPKKYDVSLYTNEAFRMFSTQKTVEVELLGEAEVMKAFIDRFGPKIHTRSVGPSRFTAKVKVCIGPTFYRWIFGWSGKIRILGPEEVRSEYRQMLQEAVDSFN